MNNVHCLTCEAVYKEMAICPKCGNEDLSETVFLSPYSTMKVDNEDN